MPRYFFDVYSNSELFADERGVELENSHAACQTALGLLPSPSRDDLPAGEMQSFRVVVRCQDGGRHFLASLIYAGMWLRPLDTIELY